MGAEQQTQKTETGAKRRGLASRTARRLRHGLRRFSKTNRVAVVVRVKWIELFHRYLLWRLRDRKTLRVGFVVLTDSTWKLEGLLRLLEQDARFETAIAVTEFLPMDEDRRKAEAQLVTARFAARGEASKVFDRIEDFKGFRPDIVFLPNPHEVTPRTFYTDLFKNYLCCYVPYAQDVSHYDDNQAQYNQRFHNWMWRIFTPHETSQDLFRATSERAGSNAVLTGYPGCEALVANAQTSDQIWKSQDKRKIRIIWAPHHTINQPDLPYANFLEYSDAFVQLAKARQDEIQWAFKPHPLLRDRLYQCLDWGVEKTDAYYAFWDSQTYTQFENGAYQDLFLQSDAMIHDSGSFLAEYLHVQKPVLYLQKSDAIAQYLNAFGRAALSASSIARTFEDVIAFVDALQAGEFPNKDALTEFHSSHIERYFEQTPSHKIKEHLIGAAPKLKALAEK